MVVRNAGNLWQLLTAKLRAQYGGADDLIDIRGWLAMGYRTLVMDAISACFLLQKNAAIQASMLAKVVLPIVLGGGVVILVWDHWIRHPSKKAWARRIRARAMKDGNDPAQAIRQAKADAVDDDGKHVEDIMDALNKLVPESHRPLVQYTTSPSGVEAEAFAGSICNTGTENCMTLFSAGGLARAQRQYNIL